MLNRVSSIVNVIIERCSLTLFLFVVLFAWYVQGFCRSGLEGFCRGKLYKDGREKGGCLFVCEGKDVDGGLETRGFILLPPSSQTSRRAAGREGAGVVEAGREGEEVVEACRQAGKGGERSRQAGRGGRGRGGAWCPLPSPPVAMADCGVVVGVEIEIVGVGELRTLSRVTPRTHIE